MSCRQLSAMIHWPLSRSWYISIHPPTRSSSAGDGRGSPAAARTSPICSAMVASEVRWAKASGLSQTSWMRSEEHTSELQSRLHLVCRLLLEKKKKKSNHTQDHNTGMC